MKLLLIDDDEVDRLMVARLLRNSRTPIDIVEAATAQAGLALFEADGFDAVLLDFLLPDMPGLEVLQVLLLSTQRRAGVIILTGRADEALELACLEAGAQDFLLKKDITDRHLERALLHARARHRLEMKLIESREQLRLLAESDPLTNLANRYFFDRTLRAALARSQRHHHKLALLLLDLDNFKQVNDILGHDMGDRLLREVADRLLRTTRDGDVVCRLGGDEFAIVTWEFDSETTMARLAERLLAALRAPMRIAGHDLVISSSIGIATTPEGGTTAEALLKNADLAMYQAKRDGRNGFRFFSTAFQIAANRKAMLEQDLRSPQACGQLQLFFQPLLTAGSERLCGAEALIRWNHPRLGLLQPGAFLDVAEECGLMGMIDAWSRHAACAQLSLWRAGQVLADDFVMSFNVSAATLRQDGLERAIQQDLIEAGLDAGCMEMEVTESSLVEDFDKSAALLARVRSYGVSIALDDFGTGYSSMGYLKQLPAGTLKIDRSFLKGVPELEADTRLLRAMIAMAKSLDLRVIVEGVESADQARLCRDYGAHVLQGFVFSPPLASRDFETMVGTRRQQA